jgi:hypothetical protein
LAEEKGKVARAEELNEDANRRITSRPRREVLPLQACEALGNIYVSLGHSALGRHEEHNGGYAKSREPSRDGLYSG